MILDHWHHTPSFFSGSTETTYHHHAILVNGQSLICNDSQIDNCVKQCARQFMPVDQRACVQAVEARFAPYSKCFSGSSTVIVRGRPIPVEMRDLAIGDYVLDVNLQYVRVVGWLHRDETVEADFIQFTHSYGTLQVTDDHLIYCDRVGDYVPAKWADTLKTIYLDGSMAPSRIESRRVVRSTGIYAPLTCSGTLLVNGVNVSCYASPEQLPFPVTQASGQMALAPYRYLGTSILPDMEQYCRSLYSIFAS